jgi:hypothetical protein
VVGALDDEIETPRGEAIEQSREHGVPLPTRRRGYLAVEVLAQLVVGRARRAAGPDDHVPRGEVVQAPLDVVARSPADLGEPAKRHGMPVDRDPVEQVAGGRLDGGEPPVERRGHGRRDLDSGDAGLRIPALALRVNAAALHQGAHHLLNEERVAPRLDGHARRERVGRSVAAEHGGDELGRALQGERRERQAEPPLGVDRREELVERRRRLVVAVRDDHG